MQWIYLSPHLDDAALSCGGLIWEQARAGEEASVWTICAGDVPGGPLSAFAGELHARWRAGGDATAQRRQEDLASCAILGAEARHFPLPDCIYRRAGLDYWDETGAGGHQDGQGFYYPDREAIFGPLHPQEAELVRQLAAHLEQALPPMTEVVCPLALGGHVDHRLTRAAAESLGRPLWYYADYPYILEQAGQVEELQRQGWQARHFPVSENGLQAWINSVAAHRSQISTFWPDLPAMRQAIRFYCEKYGGVSLWRPRNG